MKVNVLQVEDAKFSSRFSFWSNWVDICVFEGRTKVYLLQMKVNRFNRKKFATRHLVGNGLSIFLREVGDLTQMEGSYEQYKA